MGLARQIMDVLVAGLIAGVSSFLVSAVSPNVSITLGVALACMYYFSRYPWGSRQGADYNKKIDELYNEFLPF